jgi:hypothetical protein
VPGGWGWRAGGEFGPYSGWYGSQGGNFSTAGLGYGNDGFSGGMGPYSMSNNGPALDGQFGFVGGGVQFSPYETTFCAGPAFGVPDGYFSAQACYTAPYGYQNGIDSAAQQLDQNFGYVNDPNAWMGASDPFGYGMGY